MPDTPAATTLPIVVHAEPGANVRVAVRDGDGAWARAMPAADGSFSATIASGRYGIAVTCVDDLWQELRVLYATVAEQPAPELVVSCGFPDDPIVIDKHVSGTISGLAGAGYTARLGLSSLRDTSPGTSLAYAKDTIGGTWSFAVGRYAAQSAQQHVDRVAIRRDLVIAGDQVENVNLATEGVATESRDISVGNLAGDDVLVRSRFRTANSFNLTLASDATEPFTIDLPAAAQWIAGDRLAFSVSATNQTDLTAERTIERTFTRPDLAASFALELPAPLDGFSFSGTPASFRATWTPHPTATSYTMDVFSNGIEGTLCGGLCFPLWGVEATPGYFGGATTHDLRTPEVSELTAIDVWDPRLDMTPGFEMFWSVDAIETRADGFTYRAGHRDTIVP
ncbi:MAG TPA: hypothetical protein VFQ53_41815 [Kofleriaceae bacterium]|nr:hypothetical protein [Kofleriaceae bacterium]